MKYNNIYNLKQEIPEHLEKDEKFYENFKKDYDIRPIVKPLQDAMYCVQDAMDCVVDETTGEVIAASRDFFRLFKKSDRLIPHFHYCILKIR